MATNEYLLDLYAAAMNAADAAAKNDGPSTEENRCIKALNKLKVFPVDPKILIETQAGKNLRKLTKHSRKKIQASAVDLIAIWKKKYLASVKKSDNNKLDSSPVVAKRTKLEQQSSSPKMAKTEPELKKSPPLTTSMLNCNDAAREKVRTRIWEALCKVSEEADESIREEVKLCDPIRVSISVETALFKKLGKVGAKHRSVVFNLKDEQNPDFRRKVLLGIVKAESVAEMSSEEMASDKRRAEIEKIREEALAKIGDGGEEKGSTDAFRCGKCGKRECNYKQIQTRSADEPMTTFVVCVNCKNRWKFC